MKKIIFALSLLFTFSAYANFASDQALNLATQEAYVLLKDHFQLQSPEELKDITSLAQNNMLKNIDDKEFKKILKKYPLKKNFYVDVHISDCVVASVIYVIGKTSGKVRVVIMLGDEISIEEK